MTDPGAANDDSRTPQAPRPSRVARAPTSSGKSKVGERLEREAAARRVVFATALAGFVLLFGLIATADKPTPAVSQEQPATARDVTRANRVLAEIPIPGHTADAPQTIVRLVAPESQGLAPHARTRAS